MNDAAKCPLCGQPNHCQVSVANADPGDCWCSSMVVPDALLARVPAEARNKACLCKSCVTAFHREIGSNLAGAVLPGDYYFDPGGLMVFTEAYHRRRGYCCESGCRHCPYEIRLR